MKRKKRGNVVRQERTRIIRDERIDSYREKKKFKDDTVCPDCGALFKGGRWTWNVSSDHKAEALCPACRRVREHYPAGFVEVSGPFFDRHSREIVNQILNIERSEYREHPLERIIELNKANGILQISTTGIHLPRRIGDALEGAYQGELTISYEAENTIRVVWNR